MALIREIFVVNNGIKNFAECIHCDCSNNGLLISIFIGQCTSCDPDQCNDNTFMYLCSVHIGDDRTSSMTVCHLELACVNPQHVCYRAN